MHFTKFRLIYWKIFYTKYCTIWKLYVYSISWKILNKLIAYNRCEIHHKFDEGLWKKVATLRVPVIVQTSCKICNEKLVFPIALLFYTQTCITLLSVLAELFAYEAAIVLVFQRSLVLSLDKDNIKSIQMFVGVSTTSKRYMYSYRMKNRGEFVFIKWERKLIKISYHVYYL